MKTIYLVYGTSNDHVYSTSGDHKCTRNWAITTTLSKERALILTKEFQTKALELKERVKTLKRPELTSWTDPDKYRVYYKQNVAYHDAVTAIEQEHPVRQYLNDIHVDLDADFSYEAITLHEE